MMAYSLKFTMNILNRLRKRSNPRARVDAKVRPRLEFLESRVVLSFTPTITNLTASLSPAVYGQSETVTAQVQAIGSASTPPGTVQFLVDGSPVGSPVSTSSANTAAFVPSTLPIGQHSFSAFFYEDGTSFDSSGGIVVPFTQDYTKTTGQASAPQLLSGQAETLTTTVSSISPSQATPSGTVQFLVDGAAFGPAVTLHAGQASLTTTAIPVGNHEVTSTYTPDSSNFTASDDTSAPVAVSVETGPVTVTAPSTSTIFGQSTTFTVVVLASSSSAGLPTGMVTFKDVSGGSTTVLGASSLAVVQGQDEATFTTRLAVGTHPIVASYSGDASNAAASSTPFTLTVHEDPTSIDLDGDGKADLSVFGPIGSTGKYGFQTLTSSTNFSPARAVVFNNNGWGFGNKTSIPVSADYFGDGKSAYALWTPNNLGGMTFTAVSSVVAGKTISVNFGGTNDVPVIADVDGDGKADFGVYGYQAGLGYRFDFLLSSDNFKVNQQDVFNNNGYGYGNSMSIPVVADFDGSGKAGFGLFNPSTNGSEFTYVSASGHVSFSRNVGGPTDIPSAVNYDGDGKADLALYGQDPLTGNYRFEVLTSSSNYDPTQLVTFDNNGYGYGNAYATPVLADYEGTGKADLALYTTDFAGGMVFDYQTSQTGAGVSIEFGTAGDIALTTPSYLRARLVRGLA